VLSRQALYCWSQVPSLTWTGFNIPLEHDNYSIYSLGSIFYQAQILGTITNQFSKKKIPSCLVNKVRKTSHY
jgi:hypothetical protein